MESVNGKKEEHMKRHQAPEWGKPGNIAVMGAFALLGGLGIFALLVNIGLLRYKKTQGQNIAEAAALAAVKELNATPTGLTTARNMAALFITANDPNNELQFNRQTEVVFGIWNGSSFSSSTEPLAINAVKVLANRSTQKNNAVSVLLSGILGSSAVEVSSSAIAVSSHGGAVGEANVFPMAASDCGFLKAGVLACGREVIMGDDPGGSLSSKCPNNPSDCFVDASGNQFNWTTGIGSDSGTSAYRDMANELIDCLEGRECNPTHLELGDSITLQGGNHAGAFGSDGSLLPDYLRAHGTLDVQIPVFDGGSCSSGNNTSVTHEIIGFGTFRINKVVSSGSNKYIRGTILCGQSIGQPGNSSAENFGTSGKSNSALVQ